MNQNGLEIERKYLIRMPDVRQLEAMPGCEVWEITQTYLHDGADGSTHRVRSIRTEKDIHYVHTVKHRLSDLSHDEWEVEIPRAEYGQLLEQANPALQPIRKFRYRIPNGSQLLEIDIYSFWQDRATLEVELKSEDEQVVLPGWIKIVREVTGERAYKNRFLAEEVPMDELE